MGTNGSKYIPTPSEKKLLEVLMNPEYYSKSITEICKQAGVSRKVYYKAIVKPEFVELMNNITNDILKGKVQDIIMASYWFAIQSPSNFQDRKMLLELVGIYRKRVYSEYTNEKEQRIKVSFKSEDNCKNRFSN